MKFDILKKINSNTLVAFAVGVLFTILFNLVVNKDPFKIDSDTISALANVGTLLVAMIAALQVNKWLNSKINDTAFKQSQLIIEAISRINMSSRLILEDCFQMFEREMLDAIDDMMFGEKNNRTKSLLELNSNITKHIKTIRETSLQLEVLVYELPMWNIKLKNDDVKSAIQKIMVAATNFAEKCDEIDNHIINQSKRYLSELTDEIIHETHPALFEYLKPILTKNYHDIFSPITSPVKKDD